jgi:hypothetical protein
MGVHPACFFINRAGKIATIKQNSARKKLFLSCAASLSSRTNWQAPGDFEPEKVARCIEEVEAISSVELGELLGPAYPMAWGSTRELLAHAGYLVVLVACYPDIDPIDNIERSYGNLLSAALLREIVGDTPETTQ